MLPQPYYEDGDYIENDIFYVLIVMNVAHFNPGNIFDAFKSVFDKKQYVRLKQILKTKVKTLSGSIIAKVELQSQIFHRYPY